MNNVKNTFKKDTIFRQKRVLSKDESAFWQVGKQSRFTKEHIQSVILPRVVPKLFSATGIFLNFSTSCLPDICIRGSSHLLWPNCTESSYFASYSLSITEIICNNFFDIVPKPSFEERGPKSVFNVWTVDLWNTALTEDKPGLSGEFCF